MATNKEEALEIVGDYKYGFTTETTPVLTSGKGLNREVVEFISDAKHEPKWMKEFRLAAYDAFVSLENPSWGPDLSGIDFQEYTYYIKSVKEQGTKWEDVPKEIRDTFDTLISLVFLRQKEII